MIGLGEAAPLTSAGALLMMKGGFLQVLGGCYVRTRKSQGRLDFGRGLDLEAFDGHQCVAVGFQEHWSIPLTEKGVGSD